ncbi:hypothetical protein MBAV_005555 [Candidatus Magnetobacterium bavaricum]|uniref:Uncharacterized protein n=1 Tax=Candidatus Magnetobacterium bavaricum TaxID=29290 RepID=A0A0F3GNI1_9BACT|nr:hypothetical protein MBAV_005555 [Candidatus Magnetobacterium bavaricum]
MAAPFINQMTTSPVFEFRHRMSLLPSPSKSFFVLLLLDLNSTATILSAVILTVHWLPMDTSQPLQAINSEPSAGDALIIT